MKNKKDKKHNLDFQSMVSGMPRINIRLGKSRRIYDCGDVVAQALSGKTRSELGDLVGEIYDRCRRSEKSALIVMARELELMKLTSKFNAFHGYSKLNFGLQRINIGNRIRNAIRRSGATLDESIEIVGLKEYTHFEKPRRKYPEPVTGAVTRAVTGTPISSNTEGFPEVFGNI